MSTNPQLRRSIRLKRKEVERRADNIRLLLTDCDGVLTDTGVYYSEWGEAMKRFSIRDGMAVALLRDCGIDTGVLSGENSQSLRRRAEKLDLRHVYLGAKNKMQFLDLLFNSSDLKPDEIAYIGDDVNDLGVIGALKNEGLVAAPGDAMPSVLCEVHYVCRLRGGQGAFREFADWILSHRSVKGMAKKEITGKAAVIVQSPVLN